MARKMGNDSVKSPSIGGTIAKVVFGVIFASTSFGEPENSDPVVYLVMGLSIGLGLIAWGLLPWLRVWKESKRRAAQEEKKERLLAEERAARENTWKVCPSCGATSRGKVCEYCGSKLP